MQTMTVGELRAAFENYPDNVRVKGWLPGSAFSIRSAFLHNGELKLECDLDEGSALALLLERQSTTV